MLFEGPWGEANLSPTQVPCSCEVATPISLESALSLQQCSMSNPGAPPQPAPTETDANPVSVRSAQTFPDVSTPMVPQQFRERSLSSVASPNRYAPLSADEEDDDDDYTVEGQVSDVQGAAPQHEQKPHSRQDKGFQLKVCAKSKKHSHGTSCPSSNNSKTDLDAKSIISLATSDAESACTRLPVSEVLDPQAGTGTKPMPEIQRDRAPIFSDSRGPRDGIGIVPPMPETLRTAPQLVVGMPTAPITCDDWDPQVGTGMQPMPEIHRDMVHFLDRRDPRDGIGSALPMPEIHEALCSAVPRTPNSSDWRPDHCDLCYSLIPVGCRGYDEFACCTPCRDSQLLSSGSVCTGASFVVSSSSSALAGAARTTLSSASLAESCIAESCIPETVADTAQAEAVVDGYILDSASVDTAWQCADRCAGDASVDAISCDSGPSEADGWEKSDAADADSLHFKDPGCKCGQQPHTDFLQCMGEDFAACDLCQSFPPVGANLHMCNRCERFFCDECQFVRS